MIFKTYETDLDGISNKLGFSKRSFAEWGIQVSQSFNNAGKGLKGFKEAFKTAFIVPQKLDEIKLINEADFSSVFPVESAKSFFEYFNKSGSQSVATLTQWCDKLGVTDKTMKAYLVDCMQKQVPTSFEGYNNYVQAAIANNKQLTLSAKATAVGMKALSIAGNMLAVWAITKVVSLVAKGIDELAHSAEHCKERVDELMSNYQSALDNANSNAKTVEELASRYEKLSKGVNNLGENVSLATDEYTEYNKIANQIADMFPTLIQGYTSEGNAILSLKGNVEGLRDAYKEAQQEAYNLLIADGKDSDGNDIVKNAQNTINGEHSAIFGKIGYGVVELNEAYTEVLDAIVSRDLEQIKKAVYKYENSSISTNLVLDKIGINWSDLFNTQGLVATEDELCSIQRQIKALIQSNQAEIDSAISDVRILANAYLMTNEDYAKLDDQSKNAASIIVNSINENIASEFKDKLDVGEYVIAIVDTIKDNPDLQDALYDFSTLDYSSLSINDAILQIDSYMNAIANAINLTPLESRFAEILGLDDIEISKLKFKKVFGVNLTDLKSLFGFDDVDDTAKRLRNALRALADDHGSENREILSSDEYKELLEIVNNLTFAEAELCLETINDAENVTDALNGVMLRN